MSLFSKPKSTSYLGLDIGTGSIKMVELEKQKGQVHLLTYGFAEDITSIRDNTSKAGIKIGRMIREIYSKAQVKTSQVIAALPNYSVFSSVININASKKENLSSLVQLEARKFVPMPLEQVILDWKIIPIYSASGKQKNTQFEKSAQKSNKLDDLQKAAADLNSSSESFISKSKSAEKFGSSTDNFKNSKKFFAEKTEDILQNKSAGQDSEQSVLITAAPKNLIKKYLDIFKEAELNLLSLETESFALSRVFSHNDKFSVLIVDIGATATDIIIVERGVPIISRSIDIGGDTITQSVQKSLNLDLKRAEQFKRDVGFSPNKEQLSGVGKLIEVTFDSVINEIHYSIDLYQTRGASLDHVILSGGSAYLIGLKEYLESHLNLKVSIGNPWDIISYPQEIESLLHEVGSSLAVSAGLAMREIV